MVVASEQGEVAYSREDSVSSQVVDAQDVSKSW